MAAQALTLTDPGSGSWHAAATLDGVPDITTTHPYTHTTKTIRPDFIHATWGGNARTGWHFERVTISGYVLKKDGTPGLMGHRIAFPGSRLTEAPGYAQEWVASVKLPLIERSGEVD